MQLCNRYVYLFSSELNVTMRQNNTIYRTKYTYPKIPQEDEKFVIRSPYSDVEIPEINLADFVWQNVDKWPENVALVSSFYYLILFASVHVNAYENVCRHAFSYTFLISIQVCGMTGRQYTYEMAHNMSKQFGSALLRMGAKKGDVLAMVVPNIPEFCIAYLGAVGVGITLTTMNPTYKPGMYLWIKAL